MYMYMYVDIYIYIYIYRMLLILADRRIGSPTRLAERRTAGASTHRSLIA